MGKSNLVYICLVAGIILLAISTGFFAYQYQQKSSLVSEKVSFLSTISNFEKYSADYYKETSMLSDLIDKINITDDYTSCMNYVNKWAELHTKYNQNENKKLIFLQSISVNEECNNAISKFSSLINTTKDIRDNDRTKIEKWCYGYHKVDWSYTWEEEYSTPWDVAVEELGVAEEKLGDAFSDAEITCLKQISK